MTQRTEHTVLLGAEFHIHHREVPKLGTRWFVEDSYDDNVVQINCELVDTGPRLGDTALRKFIFDAIDVGTTEVRLLLKKGDTKLEEAVYLINVVFPAA